MISEVGDDRCRHAERQDGISIEHHYVDEILTFPVE
jgi:hypothetical protein